HLSTTFSPTLTALLSLLHHHMSLFLPPPPSAIYTLSLHDALPIFAVHPAADHALGVLHRDAALRLLDEHDRRDDGHGEAEHHGEDRKSTRLNSSHVSISYAVFCLKKKTSRERCSRRIVAIITITEY